MDICAVQMEAIHRRTNAEHLVQCGSTHRKVGIHGFPVGRGQPLFHLGLFLKGSSHYTAIRESKGPTQKSTQKPSIHAQKINNDNSFFPSSSVLFWKISKSPGGLKKSRMNTHLPFTEIGQLLVCCHICAMCVIHIQTHIIHSFLTEPLHSWGVICRLESFI